MLRSPVLEEWQAEDAVAKQAMRIYPEERTDEDISAIQRWLNRQSSDLRRFFAFAEQSVQKGLLRYLCSRLKMLTVNTGTVVFRQGDVGDSFYVIVDGSCDIYHHSVRRSAKKVEEVEPIGFSGAQIQTASDRIQLGSRIGSIGAGDCFGELNLGFGDKRLATIVANGDGTGGKTILLQVDRQSYERVMAPMFRSVERAMKKRAEFLRTLSLFSDWPTPELLFLSYWAMDLNLKPKTIIYSAGNPSNNVYLLSRGSVSLVTRGDGGKDLELERVLAPGMFGVVDAYRRYDAHTFSAVAFTQAHLCAIPTIIFQKLVLSELASEIYTSAEKLKKYVECREEWHQVRAQHGDDVSIDLVEEIQNRFVNMTFLSTDPPERKVAEAVDDTTPRMAFASPNGTKLPAASPVDAGDEATSPVPVYRRGRLNSVVGEDWLAKSPSERTPEELEAMFKEEAVREMRVVQKAVHAFKRLLKKPKGSASPSANDGEDQISSPEVDRDDEVSGSLSRIDTKPKLSQRGSRRNLNRGLPSRSRLRLTQLETASTDSGESDQDDAVSEITDFSSGRRSRGIPHAASFSLGSRGSRHQFSTADEPSPVQQLAVHRQFNFGGNEVAEPVSAPPGRRVLRRPATFTQGSRAVATTVETADAFPIQRQFHRIRRPADQPMENAGSRMQSVMARGTRDDSSHGLRIASPASPRRASAFATSEPSKSPELRAQAATSPELTAAVKAAAKLNSHYSEAFNLGPPARPNEDVLGLARSSEAPAEVGSTRVVARSGAMREGTGRPPSLNLSISPSLSPDAITPRGRRRSRAASFLAEANAESPATPRGQRSLIRHRSPMRDTGARRTPRANGGSPSLNPEEADAWDAALKTASSGSPTLNAASPADLVRQRSGSNAANFLTSPLQPRGRKSSRAGPSALARTVADTDDGASSEEEESRPIRSARRR